MFLISKLKLFLDRTNAMTLILGVMTGAAINRVFIAFLDDVFKPFLTHVTGLRDWSTDQLVLSQTIDVAGKTSVNVVKYGHFGELLFDLFVTGVVVLVALRFFRKEPVRKDAPSTTECPNCSVEHETNSLQNSPWVQIDFSPDGDKAIMSAGASREQRARVTSVR